MCETVRAVHRYADAETLYAAIAAAFVDRARRAIGARGVFHVALAGGSTPRSLYRKLAAAPLRDAVDWSRIEIWFGDERCVPPDSPRSNFHMVEETLLRPLPSPVGRVHRMRGELPPAQAAQQYQDELRARLPGAAPCLDLVLLGVGPDGHTASLFPGTPALAERKRWVFDQYVDAQREWRLTLTYPVLDAAAGLWVLVEGAGKAAVVEQVLGGGKAAGEPLPVQRLAPAGGDLEWWLDAAAAQRLPPAPPEVA